MRSGKASGVRVEVCCKVSTPDVGGRDDEFKLRRFESCNVKSGRTHESETAPVPAQFCEFPLSFVQTPATHVLFPWHTMPQPPQFELSVAVSMHAPEHRV